MSYVGCKGESHEEMSGSYFTPKSVGFFFYIVHKENETYLRTVAFFCVVSISPHTLLILSFKGEKMYHSVMLQNSNKYSCDVYLNVYFTQT